MWLHYILQHIWFSVSSIKEYAIIIKPKEKLLFAFNVMILYKSNLISSIDFDLC